LGTVLGVTTARSCPDWAALLDVAPDLLFKHYTAAEARLPAEALANLSEISLGTVEICADLEHNVFNPDHTDEKLAEALRATHWFDVREWVTTGPGAQAQ
jgi:hypothetical protein